MAYLVDQSKLGYIVVAKKEDGEVYRPDTTFYKKIYYPALKKA